MRISLLGLVTAAVLSLATPVAAENTGLFPMFKTFCLDHDADRAKGIAAATALGFKPDAGAPPTDGGMRMTSLIGNIGSRKVWFVFGTGQSGEPPLLADTCTLSTNEADDAALSAVKAWAPKSPVQMSGSRTYIPFRQTPRGRAPLDTTPRAVFEAAEAAGEMGLLTVDAKDRSTTLVLVRSRKAR